MRTRSRIRSAASPAGATAASRTGRTGSSPAGVSAPAPVGGSAGSLLRCCPKCTHNPDQPCADLVRCLAEGPLCHADEPCRTERAKIVARLRGETADRPALYIGTGTCGLGAGAARTASAVRRYLYRNRIQADVVEVGCLGLCSAEPVLDVQLPGQPRVSFEGVIERMVVPTLDAVFAGKRPETPVLGLHSAGTKRGPWRGIPGIDEHPFFAGQTRRVLDGCGIIDPASIDAALAHGAYRALAGSVLRKTSEEVCKTVESSGLRGRSGGFPLATKWETARSTPSDQRYVICNANEGDPGAFIDRALIEGNPHRLLEGLAIAGYAIGATRAIVYIRADYTLAISRLQRAIDQAREYGLLGKNILDSGFRLEVAIQTGAGAFLCGEETALIRSVEGKRGMPRPRPPFPAAQGLFGKPTLIHNVETLANLPRILSNGPEWFSSIGTETGKGTKVFSLSGNVARTGLVEVAMGTPVRRIIEEIGGGIPGGRAVKAAHIGGPSGGCIPAENLDVAADYESLAAAGALMGSGGLLVLDEGACMVDLARYFVDFAHRESCGACIPCREGTRRMLEILDAITRPHRDEAGIDALERFQGIMQLRGLAEVIADTSLCGLGQSAPNPLLTALRWFPEEFEAHVYSRKCPARVCAELRPARTSGGAHGPARGART